MTGCHAIRSITFPNFVETIEINHCKSLERIDAALIVRDRPYSSYSSSRGSWNWASFMKCLGVAAVVMGVFTLVELVAFPDTNATGENLFTVAGVIACLVLVPLQCVAEEYLFRGFLLQTFASWTKLPIIGIIVSAVFFAAGHPYNDIGVVAILPNGLIWGFVAWRTNGLEATSALHVVNNLLAFFMTGFGLQASTSEIDIMSLVITVAVDIVYATAVLLLGKRFGWLATTGDAAAAFNEKHATKFAAKHPMQPAPAGQPYVAQPATMQAPVGQSYAGRGYAMQPTAMQAPAGQPYAAQPATAQPYASQPQPYGNMQQRPYAAQQQPYGSAQQLARPDGAPEPPPRYRG